MLAHQTSAEEAGRIAQDAGVKTLVLSHFVPPDDPAVTDAMWLDAARRHSGVTGGQSPRQAPQWGQWVKYRNSLRALYTIGDYWVAIRRSGVGLTRQRIQ